MFELMFWTCWVLVLYNYAVYPVLIWGLSRRFGSAAMTTPNDPDVWPEITLLIAAYNEEAVIEERVRNALAMDYPPDRLEIVIGLDGCSDGTAAIVRRFADRGVRLLDYPQRRGKASVLNAAMAEVKSRDRLDCPTQTRRSIRRRCAGSSAGSGTRRVGAVVGRLILTDPRTGSNADSLYWKYETFLKRCEGRLGGPAGCERGDLRHPARPLRPDSARDDHRRFRHPLAGQAPLGLHSSSTTARRSRGRRRHRTSPPNSTAGPGSGPAGFRASPCSGDCSIPAGAGSPSPSSPTRSCAGCARSS